MSGLDILRLAPGATIQDHGRPGLQRYGVCAGGAVDEYALAEGQALLGSPPDAAALEFAGDGGRFRARGGALRLATSGATMRASLAGEKLRWRSSFTLAAGEVLDIGPATDGTYGYLHVLGGFDTEMVLGSRSTHIRAGLGHAPVAGDCLPVFETAVRAGPPLTLPEPPHLGRTEIRALWGPQAHVFSPETRASFAAASFKVGAARDRMGIRLDASCGPIHSETGQTILSEAISLGDFQIPGDGRPVAMLADRGPTGGYPRIATVISADIAALAQLRTGSEFRLRMVEEAEALTALRQWRDQIARLPAQVQPLVRDPATMADLLSYTLVDGVLRGDEHDHD
jgi:biotin-dependent carboxylase-like uncharacterized protein